MRLVSVTGYLLLLIGADARSGSYPPTETSTSQRGGSSVLEKDAPGLSISEMSKDQRKDLQLQVC